MPAGLQLASKLDEPIFTPSTKATAGSNCAHLTARMDERTGRPIADRNHHHERDQQKVSDETKFQTIQE